MHKLQCQMTSDSHTATLNVVIHPQAQGGITGIMALGGQHQASSLAQWVPFGAVSRSDGAIKAPNELLLANMSLADVHVAVCIVH